MDRYVWTSHSEFKMKYYRLSKQKVTGIIRRPDRVERGIAGNGTIAVMQTVSPKIVEGKKVWKQEIWTMYQKKRERKSKKSLVFNDNLVVQRLRNHLNANDCIKIISAWRYPGVSPKNNPIPEEIFREIMEFAKKH